MAFLAVIGLIAILYIIKKMLLNVGNFFEGLSQCLSNQMIAKTYPKRSIPIKSNDLNEKIKAIKGDGTDKEYMDAVHREIDDLLK